MICACATRPGISRPPGQRGTRPKSANHPSPHPQCAGGYVPLRVRSYYTFLDSTLVARGDRRTCARQHGLAAIALTDLGNLHGAVEFAQAAKRAGIKPVFGTELQTGGHPLLLYVESARGYHSSTGCCPSGRSGMPRTEEGAVAAQQRRPISLELLAAFYRRADCGQPGFTAGGTVSRPVLPDGDEATAPPGPGGCGAFRSWPVRRFITRLPGDRMKYDIVQSIRTLTLLRQEHPAKRLDGRLHFRTPAEMAAACQEPSRMAGALAGNRRPLPF